MLKRIVNEASFDLEIETKGPLLIRSGQATVSGPDMTPVRTYRNGEWQVYMPGSSLKGVSRSHAEKIVRTLDGNPAVCCDPFSKSSCCERLKKRELPPKEAYSYSCSICRLFGSTEFIGRISIGDGYLVSGGRRELRDGVGIDRLTGGASHGAKFELEAVSPGAVFRSSVLVRNFECWQLGMLLAVIHDMSDRLVRVGGGRSRGFGDVTARIPGLTIFHMGRPADHQATEVWGMGRFLNDGSYETKADDVLRFENPLDWKNNGIRRSVQFASDQIAGVRDRSMDAFSSRIEHWSMPAEKPDVGGRRR